MVYAERYVGFWLSFTLPTVMFALCPLVLLVFHKKYRLREPTDSVLEKAVRLIKFACKGKVSVNPVRTYVTNPVCSPLSARRILTDATAGSVTCAIPASGTTSSPRASRTSPRG